MPNEKNRYDIWLERTESKTKLAKQTWDRILRKHFENVLTEQELIERELEDDFDPDELNSEEQEKVDEEFFAWLASEKGFSAGPFNGLGSEEYDSFQVLFEEMGFDMIPDPRFTDDFQVCGVIVLPIVSPPQNH